MRSMRTIDLTAHRFGRVVAIKQVPRGARVSTHAVWEYRCDCGNVSEASSSNLRQGLVQSCGCLRDDKARARNLTHGEARHRGKRASASREYRAWCAMKTRCDNPNQSSYDDYGGRGITICARWRDSFPAFLEDMGRCPAGRSLDRRDVNGHYEPSNCRWATLTQQANNVRASARLDFDGKSMGVSEWAQHLGIPRERLKMRLQRGWTLERALTEPPRRWPSQQPDQE